jgi:ABC-type glycerol-3-phosphate transport system substrate-binding protein
MYFGYSEDYFKIKAINPNLAFEIHHVPILSNEWDFTIANYWANGVSSVTKHQKEAFLFMQYLASKEVAQKLFIEQSKTRSFGKPYARIDLANSLKNSTAYSFIVNAPDAVSSYFIDGTYDNGINSKTNNLLNVAVDSILKGESPDNAANTLSSGILPILKHYGL